MVGLDSREDYEQKIKIPTTRVSSKKFKVKFHSMVVIAPHFLF